MDARSIDLPLKSSVALITGASTSIGHRSARLLAQAGCDLCLVYFKSRECCEALAQELAQLGRRIVLVRADLSQNVNIIALAALVEREFGQLDILVAAAARVGNGAITDVSPQLFDECLRLNVRALPQLLEVLEPLLSRSKTQHSRVIALAPTTAASEATLYEAFRGAIERNIAEMAERLESKGISIHWLSKQQCGGREEALASLVLFLASTNLQDSNDTARQCSPEA